MKLIDTLKGNGTGISKTGTTPVEYVMRVYQKQISVGAGQTIPGSKQIEGRVLPVFGQPREMLTLQMEDGSTLNFFFKDRDGNALDLAARGRNPSS